MFRKLRTPRILTLFALGAVVASTTLPAPASALSCLRPNFAEEYNRLNAVPDVYYVGLGTMTPVGPERLQQQVVAPSVVSPTVVTAPVDRERRYRFTGGFLRGNNITVNRSYAVQAVAGCSGPWCGGFPEDPSPTLIFLKVENGGATFSHRFNACPGGSHVNPTNAQIRAIQACLRQGGCGPAEIAAFGAQF